MMLSILPATEPTGLLNDTPLRDYSRKLDLFNSFAEPELRALIEGAGLIPGMCVLDAGCGTGEALAWLQEQVGPTGNVTGVDIAAAHVTAARRFAGANVNLIQADILRVPLHPGSFDFIWCVNTINHFRDPLHALVKLSKLLKPRGRIAIGQSSLVPDMYFAWDSRLERVTNEAVRSYYRDRYQLREDELAAVRSIVGLLRRAQLRNVGSQTLMIERISPLAPADEAYLCEAIFRDTWGERLRPYLSSADYSELTRLCDSRHPQFALRRTDFHYLQSFSLAVGEVP